MLGMILMVTVLSSLPNIRALPFAVCLSVCLASSTPLRAAEQGLAGMHTSDSSWLSLPRPAPHRGIDAVFPDRWDRPDDGYVVAADGRIRSVLVANVPAENDAPPPFATETLTSSEESQFDIPSDADADVVPQECSPSPMTASEIARIVVATADKHGVDPEFALAVATAESRLDRFRNSPKGARGPMQLMPATAERFGVGDICDPVSNIDGGVPIPSRTLRHAQKSAARRRRLQRRRGTRSRVWRYPTVPGNVGVRRRGHQSPPRTARDPSTRDNRLGIRRRRFGFRPPGSSPRRNAGSGLAASCISSRRPDMIDDSSPTCSQ